MNTRSGDSLTLLAEASRQVKRYFAKRRMQVKVLAVQTIALPIFTIAYKPALDRLDGADYLGTTGGVDQFVIRLKGISIRWDRPRRHIAH
jgi:hypothetical protein